MIEDMPWKTILVVGLGLILITHLPRTPVVEQERQNSDQVQVIRAHESVEPLKMDEPFKLEAPKFNFKLGSASQNETDSKEVPAFLPKKFYPRS